VIASVIAAGAYWAEWALFVWVLANQGGVPIPVVPALLGAGALAASGGSLSVVVTLAVSIAAALCADLTSYLLGRWRDSQAIDLLTRLVPTARTHVECASHLRLAHGGVLQLGTRFLPELNPIAAGLAGAAGMSLKRFLAGAAVSALAWAGSWLVIISAPLVGGQLRRQAPRRLLPHTVGRATAGNGLSAARRSPSLS